MNGAQKLFLVFLVCLYFAFVPRAAYAQGGSISGTVTDPSGAVVAHATVEIHNPVSAFDRRTSTDDSGAFTFPNLPYNPYHLTLAAKGFAAFAQDVEVRSSVPVTLSIKLQLQGATTTVTVEGGEDLLENDSTSHTDVSRELFDKLPLESASSSLSSLVTLAVPGIAADSNGLFHSFGDHAENSFSVDGQMITDQQSKVFSNQIPLDSIQSLEVIQGAPPAEYGDKTSLVINATTRSGLGVTTPHGSVNASYGAFGTSSAGFDFQYGGQKWGNFISANGLNSGRFLDGPEFIVMHDKGNEENLFDRVDYQFSKSDSIHLNIGYTRSWFQSPNSFDEQLHTCDAGFLAGLGFPCDASGTTILNPVTGAPLTPSDQRSQIGTINVAPSWTHLISSNAVFTLGAFVRRDKYNYYPSADPFSDLSPDLQVATIRQDRTLTNAGIRSSVSYIQGVHNIKAGVTYEQTFLDEKDRLGIVDPTFFPAFATFFKCTAVTAPCSDIVPFDLTQGGALFPFNGHTDVKELALYVQDTINWRNWSFNLGIRGDLYNGLSRAQQAEPRLGIAYNIKPSNTILRVSYARTLETPFNENLVIASLGCTSPFLAFSVPAFGVPCNLGPIAPGWRNEFHAGFQQAFGKYVVVDAEYLWKYTHNGYDFGVVDSTPLTFPIEWTASKIPGYAIRTSVPNFHGFTGQVVMSGVAARFFQPQVAGIPIIPAVTAPFRIDHDEHFNLTAHLQYQWRRGLWFGFNWRYDSGLVAGAVPCFNLATATCAPSSGAGNIVNFLNTITGLPLTSDQLFQSGLTCNSVPATSSPTAAPTFTSCPAAQFGSTLVKIPAPNTENDDHNPQRIQPRHLFDISAGDDNVFHGDKYRWSARFTIINLTNKFALYNFLSTFSGTHYVTPRTATAEVGFHF